jgi:hypothetical protein
MQSEGDYSSRKMSLEVVAPLYSWRSRPPFIQLHGHGARGDLATLAVFPDEHPGDPQPVLNLVQLAAALRNRRLADREVDLRGDSVATGEDRHAHGERPTSKVLQLDEECRLKLVRVPEVQDVRPDALP